VLRSKVPYTKNYHPNLESYDRVLEGIFCHETALCKFQYSNAVALTLQLWWPVQVRQKWAPPISLRYDANYHTEDTYQIGNGLYVTNIERTLCEMMRDDCYEEFVCQALLEYTDEFGMAALYPWVEKYYNLIGYFHWLAIAEEHWRDVNGGY
jgi:hypothetical protein